MAGTGHGVTIVASWPAPSKASYVSSSKKFSLDELCVHPRCVNKELGDCAVAKPAEAVQSAGGVHGPQADSSALSQASTRCEEEQENRNAQEAISHMPSRMKKDCQGFILAKGFRLSFTSGPDGASPSDEADGMMLDVRHLWLRKKMTLLISSAEL